MITLVDYGMGNLRSVSKALESLGHAVHATSDPQEVRGAERLILPGVGAFGDAMAELKRRGLVAPILDYIASDRPFLGICLGLQLLLESSEESPGVAGLGVIPGEVRRFRTQLKVPHMGWNTVRAVRPAPLFGGLPDLPYVYFVHSFYAAPRGAGLESVAGVTDYDGEFAAALWRGNLYATQFHPEKSQSVGLRMLANFAGPAGSAAPAAAPASSATTASASALA